nr:hypothetical protein [Tanacetum cinerariifolium]
MDAESSGRGQMGAESGGRDEEVEVARQLWVVQAVEEVEKEEAEVMVEEEEEVVEENPLVAILVEPMQWTNECNSMCNGHVQNQCQWTKECNSISR